MKLDLVVEGANAALVFGQQPDQELLRRLLHPIEDQRHAAARVEHDDGGDRRGLVLEEA